MTGEDREDILLVVLVFLLLMLSVVIWVAFCIAVRKTAKKFLELKRQRRREALINAAITRAAHGEEVSRRTGLPVYIATVTQGMNFHNQSVSDLPSYEQAVSMTANPTPHPRAVDRVPSYKPPSTGNNTAKRNERVVRVAPDRPGATPTMVLPPSYESAQTSSSSSSSIYTVSRNVDQTSL